MQVSLGTLDKTLLPLDDHEVELETPSMHGLHTLLSDTIVTRTPR